jgi:hypothetical protein
MYYIQILFQIINGFIAKVIQLIMSFLESIIPLDLLCLLLLILHKNASQLPILSSLMSLENVMNKFESQIMSQVQKALNPLADFANKISLNSISPNLTKELNQVINLVGMAANMPDSYLSNSLSNYVTTSALSGYNYVTSSSLSSTLNSYVLSSSLSNYFNTANLSRNTKFSCIRRISL